MRRWSPVRSGSGACCQIPEAPRDTREGGRRRRDSPPSCGGASRVMPCPLAASDLRTGRPGVQREGRRRAHLADPTRAPLLVIADVGMRKLHRRRRPARADHAPRRADLHDPHLEPTRGGQVTAPRRHRRRHGLARSTPPSARHESQVSKSGALFRASKNSTNPGATLPSRGRRGRTWLYLWAEPWAVDVDVLRAVLAGVGILIGVWRAVGAWGCQARGQWRTVWLWSLEQPGQSGRAGPGAVCGKSWRML